MLLKSVLHDISEDFLVAEVRALGIMSKLIMTPMWNVLERKDVDMAQMNKVVRGGRRGLPLFYLDLPFLFFP